MFQYTNDLFSNYVNCFIRKKQPLKEYKYQYKTHMYNIHQDYINKLKPLNKIVDKKYVIDYVNNLHPAQQMYVINYDYNLSNNTSSNNTSSNNN